MSVFKCVLLTVGPVTSESALMSKTKRQVAGRTESDQAGPSTAARVRARRVLKPRHGVAVRVELAERGLALRKQVIIQQRDHGHYYVYIDDQLGRTANVKIRAHGWSSSYRGMHWVHYSNIFS